MRTIALSDLQTVAIGLALLQLASLLVRKVPAISRASVPTPVLAGVFGSICVALVRNWWDVELQFGMKITDFMLLVFFTSVGLSAKFSALKAGGKPLVILCAATVVLIVAQNVAGIAVAMGFGAKPFFGLLVGSISFVGGPGTAAAWAKEAEAAGLKGASEVAVAGATLAVVVGALVAGPVTGWLVRRKNLQSAAAVSDVPWATHEAPPEEASKQEKKPAPISVERAMSTFLLILIAVVLGQTINDLSKAAGFVLPGFLTAMLAGVAITNGADLMGRKLAFEPIERDGEMALRTFLVMFLMSLKLWTLSAAIVPLVVNVAVQVVVSVAIAIFVLFRWLGRDYDAAVTVGGFLGFGLSSMTVGMASMDSVATRYGPSPKAFLLVTLAGSFFVDLANAFIVQGFLRLPIFHHG